VASKLNIRNLGGLGPCDGDNKDVSETDGRIIVCERGGTLDGRCIVPMRCMVPEACIVEGRCMVPRRCMVPERCMLGSRDSERCMVPKRCMDDDRMAGDRSMDSVRDGRREVGECGNAPSSSSSAWKKERLPSSS
jgi:hypothetical protein